MDEERTPCIYGEDDEGADCARCKWGTLVPATRFDYDTIVDGEPHRIECGYTGEEDDE